MTNNGIIVSLAVWLAGWLKEEYMCGKQAMTATDTHTHADSALFRGSLGWRAVSFSIWFHCSVCVVSLQSLVFILDFTPVIKFTTGPCSRHLHLRLHLHLLISLNFSAVFVLSLKFKSREDGKQFIGRRASLKSKSGSIRIASQ